MQLIVILALLVGTALATTVNYPNITVYTVSQERDDIKYGPFHPPTHHPLLSDLKLRSFIFVYPVGGKRATVYVQNGLQGLSRYQEYVQSLQQGDKALVLAYPWQLPRNVVEGISALDVVASASHGQVSIPQLPQLAAEVTSQPILLVQGRTENQLVRQEQLNEVGTVRITPDGNVQIVRDVVVERLQDPKYGPFYNPYGFVFQGYNTGYPFNYGYEFLGQYPYYGFQAQYPGYGYQAPYPFTFQAQYPYYGFQGQHPSHGYQGQYPGYAFQAQYPSYGFQGQYPGYGYQGQYPSYTFQGQYPRQYSSYGHQGQYYNYDPVNYHGGFQFPNFPGYNFFHGYNGFFPGYSGSYFYPGNSLGYNFFPNHHYPGHHHGHPFFPCGQRTEQNEQQEQTTKGYSGHQYGSYPPFTFYAQQAQYQQPQYQYGYQYQGYPFNYQSYSYPQPEGKFYQNQQYTPYQFQQYQPYQFHQYQPFQYQQYQPYQYYQNHQGQYYPH